MNQESADMYNYAMRIKDRMQSSIDRRDKEISALREEVDRMKCCGNCVSYYYDCDSCGSFCDNPKSEHYNASTQSCCYCDNWQSDGLTRKEREQ